MRKPTKTKKKQHPSTPEQQAVIDAIVDGESILVSALAGSGKTETVIRAVLAIVKKEGKPRVLPSSRILVVAFNVKVAHEIKERLRKALGEDCEAYGITVKTFNGLGHGTLLANKYGKGSLEVDTRKTRRLVSELCATPNGRKAFLECCSASAKKQGAAGIAQAQVQLAAVLDLAKVYGITPGRLLADPAIAGKLVEASAQNAEAKALLLPTQKLAAILRVCLKLNHALAKDEGVIDFNDQPYLAVTECSHIGRKWRTIIADECQPVGTRIRLAGGKEKRIENIKVGDRVMSFDTRSGILSGMDRNSHHNDDGGPREPRRIEAVRKKQYNGMIVAIGTGGGSHPRSKYTAEHWCFVSSCEDTKKHLVYMQKKGNSYRLGTTTSLRTLANRVKSEKAESAWIISTHDSESDALFQEHCLSFEFGIPTTVFRSFNSGAASMRRLSNGESSESYLERFWTRMGDMTNRADALLDANDLSIQFPFYTRSINGKGWASNFSTPNKRGFKCRAINVFPDIMSVYTIAGERGKIKEISLKTVKSVHKKVYKGVVYSLTVSQQTNGLRLYIGDSIITHNCQDLNSLSLEQIKRACTDQLVLVGDRYQNIYASMRGANFDDVMKLVTTKKMRQLELTTTFRCPKMVATRQTVSEGNGPLKRFVTVNDAKVGVISYPFFATENRKTASGSTRATAVWSFDLIDAALVHNNLVTPKSTTTIITATNADLIAAMALLCAEKGCRLRDLSQFFYRGVLYPNTVWRTAYRKTVHEPSMVDKLPSAMNLFCHATGQTPDEAAEDFAAAADLKGLLTAKLFAGTVHVQKGLEYDTVLVVNGPSFFGQAELRYVAETRTKNTLIGIDLCLHKMTVSRPKMDLRARSMVAFFGGQRAAAEAKALPKGKEWHNMTFGSPKTMEKVARMNVPKKFDVNAVMLGPVKVR